MITLSIVTPLGKIYNGEIDYLVIDGNNGQMGILENHVPVVVPIKEGFLKTVIKEVEDYYYLSGAILEQNHNTVTVIAQEAANGKTLEIAKSNFQELRQKQKESNNQRLVDFTKMERDLAKAIKDSKAGSI